MPRQIPAQLLAHKQGSSTTLCQLLKIKTRDGVVIGLTNLDRSVQYDDGADDILYHAPIGFDPASMYNSSSIEVDNTEFKALAPVYDFPLNEESVNAGEFDYADYWVYEINYADKSMGHWLVMSGKMGETRSVDGTVLWGELRSLMDQLKKPVVPLYSRMCRSIFGSDETIERIPCGYDTSTLWVSAQVVEVGDEPNRTFIINISDEEDKYVPGMLLIQSGKNAGKQVEVESFTPIDGGTAMVTLSFPLYYPILAGANIMIREDCSKIARDDVKGCKKWYGPEWIYHFNGEPDIPLGDSGKLATPGSNSPWQTAFEYGWERRREEINGPDEGEGND